MCLFPLKNKNTNGKAYQYGIKEYECGCCPECLGKKSRYWALKCGMEAKNNVGMMVTLTYDTYIYDDNGNIIGEQLPDKDLKVCKSDVQKFFKRLRHFFSDSNIKYLCTAEYGKRTHRPHYHALIFGIVFDDLRPYKKSKRGNPIYRSPTLEKIWHGGKEKKGGICTVDCVNLSAKTARYCTKYCAKDNGIDDTFMLFSRGIGEIELKKRFDGKSYFVDGREYPIPKNIWQWYIENKYGICGYSKYINPPSLENNLKKVSSWSKIWNYDIKKVDILIKSINLEASFKRYFRQAQRREIYSSYRDNDSVYKCYVNYWKNKSDLIERYRPSVFARIIALPDNKYRTYKARSLAVLNSKNNGLSYTPYRSQASGHYKSVVREKGLLSKGGFSFGELAKMGMKNICRTNSRHNTANDSGLRKIPPKIKTRMPYLKVVPWEKGEEAIFFEKNTIL